MKKMKKTKPKTKKESAGQKTNELMHKATGGRYPKK